MVHCLNYNNTIDLTLFKLNQTMNKQTGKTEDHSFIILNAQSDFDNYLGKTCKFHCIWHLVGQ